MMENKKDIYVINKEKCYGCMACYNICPCGAIDIVEDEEGFLFPRINQDKCAHCDLCHKICPSLHRENHNGIKEQKGYIAQNADTDIRIASTSGGIFSALSAWCISQNGVVFGALLDDSLSVVHKSAETMEDCAKFRGSKYVQSNIGRSYGEVKKILEQDRYVLFSGTPCQIAGLFSYLERQYDKLITVDVVCRGILSPGLFRSYLEFQRQTLERPMTNVRFREKRWGYKYTAMAIYSGNECIYAKGPESDGLLRAFFENTYDRRTCYQCQYREQYRNCDFTIWDCFNTNLYCKKMDDDKGTNKILVHSQKGKRLIEELFQKDMILLHEVKVENLLSENTESMIENMPLYNIDKRRAFFYDFGKYPPNQFWEKYYPDNIQIKLKRTVRKFLNFIGIYQVVRRLKNRYSKACRKIKKRKEHN